jgi:hypothetical protein
METTVSFYANAAVGYLKSTEDTFGTGDNLSIQFAFAAKDLEADVQYLRTKSDGIVKAIDHKHLHLEAPEWRSSQEPVAYGLRRVVQVLLFLLENEDLALIDQLKSLEVTNGVGASVLFEKKI